MKTRLLFLFLLISLIGRAQYDPWGVRGVEITTLKVTGLTAGTASDSFLVVNSGILKRLSSSIYQQALVSGSNIKTINGTSILGSGNITVTGTQTIQQTVNNGNVLTGQIVVSSGSGGAINFDDGS